MKTYIMNSKPAQIIIGLLLTLVLLWGYGYTKAVSQHKNGTMNLITMTMTALTLNPISAMGYETYVQGVLVDAAEEASKQVQMEQANKEAEELKAQYNQKVQGIAEYCIESIEKDLESGSVFVKKPVGDGNKVHFTLNMYMMKQIVDFTCEFEGNTITSRVGTTVRTY